jgi:hypothetical protein
VVGEALAQALLHVRAGAATWPTMSSRRRSSASRPRRRPARGGRNR